MKNIYQSILFSLCTATFTDCKCGKEELKLLKDRHHTIIRQDHLQDKRQALQKEKPENSIKEDKLFPIGIKLKNKDNENDIAQSDLSNEQQKIESEPEPEVKENKPNETLEQQVLRQLEEIWKSMVPPGFKILALWIDALLDALVKKTKDFSRTDRELYRSYYLSPESKTVKDKMECLQKHYDDYMKALKDWCYQLGLKELQLLIAKMENNPNGIYLEQVCIESALDPASKESLTKILIEYTDKERKYLADYISDREILDKIQKNETRKSREKSNFEMIKDKVFGKETKIKNLMLDIAYLYNKTEKKKLKSLKKGSFEEYMSYFK